MALSAASQLGTAGTFQITPGNVFYPKPQFENVSPSVADFFKADTLAPTIAARRLATSPSNSYAGAFTFVAEWSPSLPSEQPVGTPFLVIESEAILTGDAGVQASVTDGNYALLSVLGDASSWVPVSTQFIEAGTWFPKSDGTWEAFFGVSTYQVNVSGTSDAYGLAKLRTRVVGVQML